MGGLGCLTTNSQALMKSAIVCCRAGRARPCLALPGLAWPRYGLKQVQARCVLMPCTTDTYFKVEEVANREVRMIPNAQLLPIDSPWGHRAGDPGR